MRIGALTKCDLIDIKDTFNDTHPGVKATLFASNSDGVLHIYVEKQCDDGGAIEVSGEMEYSKFQHSNSPIAAICFELESVYQELIADEEATATAFDLTAIASDFIKEHPGVCVRFHASYELDALKVRVETKDCKARVDSAIPRVELTSSNDPAWVIYAALEKAYEELMQKTEKESDDVTFKTSDIQDLIVDFEKQHPGAICAISVDLAECFELMLDPGDGRLTQTREVPFSDIYYAKDPLGALRSHLESMYKGPLKEEDKDMPTKGKSIVDTVAEDNGFRLDMARCAVASWYNTHGGPRKIKPEDVYIVWFCKTLQNWKVLASTDISDGMYYEVTYDGDKDVAYVDAYKKWDNQEMLGENLREELFTSKVDIRYVGEKE